MAEVELKNTKGGLTSNELLAAAPFRNIDEVIDTLRFMRSKGLVRFNLINQRWVLLEVTRYKMTAWYGETNSMMGRPFDNLDRAIRFLRRKRAKVRYVEMHAFEKIGRVGLSATVRIDV